MIRAWMVIAPLTVLALAAFAAVIIRRQEERWLAGFRAGRNGQ